MFKKLFLTIAAVISLTACGSIGIMTQPITKTIKTAPAAYDANFTAALKAMNNLGSVQNQDKAAGYINGYTSNSVAVKIQMERDGNFTVTTSLAPTLMLNNTTFEAESDRVYNALKQNLK